MYEVLQSINSPQDLKKLQPMELETSAKVFSTALQK